MIKVARTIRFSVTPGRPAGGRSDTAARNNSFAGWPSMAGLGAHYELEVSCRGEADAQTGYMLNISAIDAAARDHAVPIIAQAIARDPSQLPFSVLRSATRALQAALGERFFAVRWRLSPYYSFEMTARDMTRAMISQQFEFAAAHRLHAPELTDAENQRIFGKCNNPSGHGHNYRVEPAVSVELDDNDGGDGGSARSVTGAGSEASGGSGGSERNGAASGGRFSLQVLERIVDERVIQHLDHKHLNLDVPEFRSLNPSVENIARVCFELLQQPVSEAGGRLEHVTVWETEKTRCTYPG